MFDGLYQYCSKSRLTKYILPQSRVKTGKPHPGVVRKPEQPGRGGNGAWGGGSFFVPQLSSGVSINSQSVSPPLAGSSLWHLQFLYKRSRQGCTMPVAPMFCSQMWIWKMRRGGWWGQRRIGHLPRLNWPLFHPKQGYAGFMWAVTKRHMDLGYAVCTMHYTLSAYRVDNAGFGCNHCCRCSTFC